MKTRRLIRNAKAVVEFGLLVNKSREIIANAREQLETNAFCPTGQGGGLDNSCSSGGGGGASASGGKSKEGMYQGKEHSSKTYGDVRVKMKMSQKYQHVTPDISTDPKAASDIADKYSSRVGRIGDDYMRGLAEKAFAFQAKAALIASRNGDKARAEKHTAKKEKHFNDIKEYDLNEEELKHYSVLPMGRD